MFVNRSAAFPWIVLLWLVSGACAPLIAQDTSNLYRFTVFPYYDLSHKFTLYARLAYSLNPDTETQTFNVISPGVYYKPASWLQIWGGLVDRYTDNKSPTADQLELRPYVG